MPASQITLAGHKVGKVGYGLMSLTWDPQPPSQDVSFAAMKAAVEAGATAWSSALFYGNPGNHLHNIRLIGEFFQKYPEYKDQVVLVVKGGLDERYQPSASVALLRSQLHEAKKLLGDKEIDVVSYARIPHGSTPQELAQNLVTLRDEGLFREIGVSEINVQSIEAFQKIAPIAVIEIEVSLWSWEKSVQEVVAWSAKNKVPVFAYSPLSRGFITRKWKSPADLPAGSFQSMSPRFQGEAFYENLKLVDQLDVLAKKKNLSTPQLAIAWVSHINPYNIPIPGSSNPVRVKENTDASTIELTDEDLKDINETLAKFEVVGGRYPEALSSHLMK